MQITKEKEIRPVPAPGEAQAAAASPDYEAELQQLYRAISSRGNFHYDPGSDSLFQSVAADYQRRGALAMRDTIGQAAALTGGYANSYAQSVGQQQYDAYLQSLSRLLPEFVSMAYQRYTDEGRAMEERYAMAREAEAAAYQRSRDAAADEAAADALAYQRGRDAAADALAADKLGYQRTQDAYAAMVRLISTAGYTPTDEELTASGLTRAQAEALLAQYRKENPEELPAASSTGRATASKSKSKKLTKSERNRVESALDTIGGAGSSMMKQQTR